MLADFSLPADCRPTELQPCSRRDVEWCAGRWTPSDLQRLAHFLSNREKTNGEKTGGIYRLSTAQILKAWQETIAELRDPQSTARRALDSSLARLCRLSKAGLKAGLETVFRGVDAGVAEEVVRQMERRSTPPTSAASSHDPQNRLAVIILASNLPGLAVQPLLPALAAKRPVLVKSSSDEPLFAPFFVEVLCRHEPGLRPSMAAVTWPGGNLHLETAVLPRADKVVAYGGGETIADLSARLGNRLIAYGPKTSLAVIGDDCDPQTVAGGLAQDIALFDQQGCLSIQMVFTNGDTQVLAAAIGEALEKQARLWPLGEPLPEVLAAVRQTREEAEMRGLFLAPTDITIGTVIAEEDQASLQPSPGARTVRVYPIQNLVDLPSLLAPWEGHLQGAALAGQTAKSLRKHLEKLGVSRFAPPGELQQPEIASWNNSGISPFAAFC